MDEENIKELIKINKEILKWIKFSNMGKVKEVLENVLDTDDKKIAYQMSNGENTSTYIGQLISPHQTTIAEWWRIWYKIGVAEPISVRGGNRAQRLFDLEDFGIKIPDIVNKKG